MFKLFFSGSRTAEWVEVLYEPLVYVKDFKVDFDFDLILYNFQVVLL